MRKLLNNPLAFLLAVLWTVTAITLILALAWPGIRGPVALIAVLTVLAQWYVLGPVDRRGTAAMQRITSVLGLLDPDNPTGAPSATALDAIADRSESLRRRLDAERRARAATDLSVRALLDAVPSPILLADTSGLLLLSNAAGAEMLGRPKDAIPGRMLEELLPRAELLALHQRATRGERAQARVRLETARGMSTFEISVIPVDANGVTQTPWRTERPSSDPSATGSAASPDQGSDAVMLSFTDVTELAAAVELKTDFVANASHELRTPVASISAALDSLASPVTDDPVVHARVVDLARNNLTRLQELIRDLLDLGRLESPNMALRMSTVSAEAMKARMTARFSDLLADRGVGLAFEIDDDAERFETDSALFDLVLSNLIDNASKFAFEQTDVRVVFERAPSEHAAADGGMNDAGTEPEPSALPPSPASKQLQATRPKRGQPRTLARDGLRLRVIDRGIGIPLNQQQRIFERFYQIDEARSGNTRRRGTGLGLAIVKHAVRTLGGQIAVTSIWQEGTTMIVTIPGCMPHEQSGQQASVAQDSSAQGASAHGSSDP